MAWHGMYSWCYSGSCVGVSSVAVCPVALGSVSFLEVWHLNNVRSSPMWQAVVIMVEGMFLRGRECVSVSVTKSGR